jgi:hypothetical protein
VSLRKSKRFEGMRGNPVLTMPARRPIKPVYIRKLIAFIDAVTGSTDGVET